MRVSEDFPRPAASTPHSCCVCRVSSCWDMGECWCYLAGPWCRHSPETAERLCSRTRGFQSFDSIYWRDHRNDCELTSHQGGCWAFLQHLRLFPVHRKQDHLFNLQHCKVTYDKMKCTKNWCVKTANFNSSKPQRKQHRERQYGHREPTRKYDQSYTKNSYK